MYIQVAVKPDNTIDIISQVIPAAPEIYKAAATRMLSEEEAINIIRAVLANSNLSLVEINDALQDIRLAKYLIPTTPYAIWENPGGKKGYVINAFTGEILTVLESVVKTRK